MPRCPECLEWFSPSSGLKSCPKCGVRLKPASELLKASVRKGGSKGESQDVSPRLFFAFWTILIAAFVGWGLVGCRFVGWVGEGWVVGNEDGPQEGVVSSKGRFWPGGRIEFTVAQYCLRGYHRSQTKVEAVLDQELREEGSVWPTITSTHSDNWGETIDDVEASINEKLTLHIPDSPTLANMTVPFRVTAHIECPESGPVAKGHLGDYLTFTNESFDIDRTLEVTLKEPPPPSRWPGWMWTPTILFFFVVCPIATAITLFCLPEAIAKGIRGHDT